MLLHLTPRIAAGLEAIASSQSISIQDYLKQLAARELPDQSPESTDSSSSYLQMENGILVYRTGTPLPAHILENAIQLTRDDRTSKILGDAVNAHGQHPYAGKPDLVVTDASGVVDVIVNTTK